MRFLVDMNLAPATARYLRERGHVATHLLERQLHHLPDEKIVELAQSEDRCIITEDLGFGTILALNRLQSPSVMILRLGNTTTEQVNAALAPVIEDYACEIVAGAIIVIEAEGVRIRVLPVW